MNATGTSTRPTRLAMILASRAGRIAAISGSRPRMSVSVWCRVWLHRQVVGSRMIMKDAIWYRAWASQRVRNAVPWPDSCQREFDRHVDQADEVGDDPGQLRGAHRGDLRVPAEDERVGVVPGVAPHRHAH